MADYYPLIARAVEGLEEGTPEAREAVYDRARGALIQQLRSLDPPLAEEDIVREQQSLDDAIGRVEATYRPAQVPALESTAAFASLEALPRAEPRFGPEDGPTPASGPDPEPAEADIDPVFDSYLHETEAPFEMPPISARPRVGSRAPKVRSEGRGRVIILSVILALVVGGIAIAAWLLRDDPAQLPDAAALAPAEAPPPAAPGGGKMAERVGGGPPLPAPSGASGAAPAARQDVGVAQRAVFYAENTANPQAPITQVGRVVWRLEPVNAGQGQPLETAVRATVEIPEANLTLNMLLRRNLDSTLPASHTVELNFTTKQGEPGRMVRDVGLLQFKSEESARGAPIAGLPVPVRENLFLIGLSNLSTDVERNIDLLLKRNWIDLPIRLGSGQRAIVSFEKGLAGEQVLNDAFRQWQ
jgi:hypothetical protein